MDNTDAAPPQTNKNRVSISFDLRWIVALLLILIIAMLALWQPWNNSQSTSNDRTIKVSGEATIKAEPDEFVFTPSYTITNANRETALADMAKKSDELTAKLKGLGIKDAQIKSNIDSYSREIMIYPAKPGESTPSYTLQLTVTAASRQEAQKVQDYLASTSPTGVISPYASFSDSKRKQLESQGRDQATKEARTKADQSAKNLGFKIGNVKTVADGSGFGSIGCGGGLCGNLAEDRAMSAPASPSIAVQPGVNELRYSVSVEYYLK